MSYAGICRHAALVLSVLAAVAAPERPVGAADIGVRGTTTAQAARARAQILDHRIRTTQSAARALSPRTARARVDGALRSLVGITSGAPRDPYLRLVARDIAGSVARRASLSDRTPVPGILSQRERYVGEDNHVTPSRSSPAWPIQQDRVSALVGFGLARVEKLLAAGDAARARARLQIVRGHLEDGAALDEVVRSRIDNLTARLAATD